MKRERNNIIGVIPAAGKALRLRNLPFSKELYPIGTQSVRNIGQIPKVAAMHLIDSMKKAGIQNYYTIIRKGKWDIPAYFKNGGIFELNMAYLIADRSYGVPYTLNQVYPFSGGKKVAMGFPDIIFQPANAYDQMVNHMENQPETDILLGLFPVNDPENWDMVEFNEKNSLVAIHIKSENANEKAMAWILAVWNSKFSEFLNNYIESYINDNINLDKNELQLSTVFLAAKVAGYKISTLKFEDGYCIDIGTQEGLEKYFATFGTETKIDSKN